MALPTKKQLISIWGINFDFTCEPCEGEYLDTEVKVNGVYFCSISYPDIQNFIDDLNQTIAKHAI